MINVGCPLCESKRYSFLENYNRESDNQGSPAVVECRKCGHIFTLINVEVDVPRLYEEGDYRVMDIRGSIFDRILAVEYSKILEKINRRFPRRGSLLDFGCGKGIFLQLARSRGWQVKGVETSAPRAGYGKSVYKLDISTGYYKGGKIEGGPFAVITLFHVLEHLPGPKELLRELVEKNLTEGGLLVIEVPNFNSLQSKISAARWLHLDLPRHVSHFREEKLVELLSRLGLRPREKGYFSFHLGVLGMVQSLMGCFGYRKKIISQLKFHRSFPLLFSILLLLPGAFILEWFASLFKRGGIVRIYAVKGNGNG